MALLKTIGIVLAVIALFVVVLGAALGFAYICYWITLQAGAPKYVAVIVGIAVFVIGGIGANSNSKES